MSTLHLNFDSAELAYPPPRGNVLLLGCMDLRLLDETVHFMSHDNLTNRYDHVIFAGAALGALGGNQSELAHWKKCFFDHLGLACELHNVADVYIIEHRNCGAYARLLGEEGFFGDSKAEQRRETLCHRRYANALKKEVDTWAKAHHRTLGVRSFLMDLRGHMTLLDAARE